MEISLLPATAERIRTALGEDVDLSPGAVPTMLARLAVEAPAVYSDVLTELSGSQIRLDSERELLRRRRRGLLRRALFGWGEYESDAGDRLVAKRHVAAAVPFGLAGLILILLGVSGIVGHRAGPISGRPPVRETTSLTAPRHLNAPSRRGAAAARRLPVSQPTHAQSSWQPHRSSATPDRNDLARSAAGLWIPDPDMPPMAAPAAPPLQPSLPRLPLTAGSESPGNPVVFSRSPAVAPGAGPGIRPGSASVPPPIVYDRSEAPWTSRPEPDGVGAPAHPGDAAARTDAPGGATPSPGATLVAAAPALPDAHWTIGQRVQARLATGVVVVGGGPPVPVVAESADPKETWLGHASLGPEGLVQIAFTLAGPGVSAAVRGVALEPARLAPGLAGRTVLRHPQAAGAVAAAALQATADYVQALARQGQVTLVDGWAQLTSGPPAPAWAYIAARLASGLDPRGVAGGPVATTEIDAGMPLVILLTAAP